MDAFYQPGRDSLPQDGVPHGKLVGPMVLPDDVYVGPVPESTGQGGGRGGVSLTALSEQSPTPMHYEHGYWVYVPAQYDPSTPAALIVFNDGQPMMDPNGDIRAINVIDNLTWRREMPVAITVFLDPGRPAGTPEPDLHSDWGDNTTLRPWEYQWLDGKYPRVVCDELLPAIKKDYNISPDPDMHAIMGSSSGGIAAFTVAWNRPDQFRKVITIVASVTHIRGGDGETYPEQVLASDKKPIRIFMCDGVNDNRTPNLSNDWHYQNVRLEQALEKKGYDVNYAWGIGNHGQKQGGMILPDMMRWLWRDYPRDFDQANRVERSFNGPATKPQ
jgi:enterochelin esterase family protein